MLTLGFETTSQDLQLGDPSSCCGHWKQINSHLPPFQFPESSFNIIPRSFRIYLTSTEDLPHNLRLEVINLQYIGMLIGAPKDKHTRAREETSSSPVSLQCLLLAKSNIGPADKGEMFTEFIFIFAEHTRKGRFGAETISASSPLHFQQARLCHLHIATSRNRKRQGVSRKECSPAETVRPILDF